MGSEEEKYRHAERRKRNILAKQLRNKEKNFGPKIIPDKKKNSKYWEKYTDDYYEDDDYS